MGCSGTSRKARVGGVWWENCECGQWQSQKVGAGFCREVGFCSKESGEPAEHLNRTEIGFEVYFQWVVQSGGERPQVFWV